jgi:Na+-transporting NADH:ubiquinone oxidoreductase subunit D
MPQPPTSVEERVFVDPLITGNPVVLRALGLCSALAVTSALLPALIMGAAVVAVLVFANVSVSAIRHFVPRSVRLIIEVTLIASAVIVVDEALKAFKPDVSAVLSVFVGLIITNCIILARVESFAMHNGVWASFLDGLGNGLGYAWVLAAIGATRELLGSGTLLGYTILTPASAGGWFEPNRLMLLTPSALFLVALLVWLLRAVQAKRPRSAAGARYAGESGGG